MPDDKNRVRFEIILHLYLYIIRHPNVTTGLLEESSPKDLSTNIKKEIALELASHPKSSRKLIKNISNLIIENQAIHETDREIVLKLCCRENISLQIIKKLLSVKGINSEFRNKLYATTNRTDIKALLKEIKAENGRQQSSRPPKPKKPKQPVQHVVMPQPRLELTPALPTRDDRLIGIWSWIDSSSSSMGFSSLSVSVEQVYVFANDGRFIMQTHSSANGNTIDSSGSWLSSNQFNSHPPEDRGRWETKFGKLHLHWDDEMVSEFDYSIIHGALELRGGDGFRRVYSCG